jgi:hypothetical protein
VEGAGIVAVFLHPVRKGIRIFVSVLYTVDLIAEPQCLGQQRWAGVDIAADIEVLIE